MKYELSVPFAACASIGMEYATSAPRAGVAERLQVALRAIDLEVGVDLFELRLAAIERAAAGSGRRAP